MDVAVSAEHLKDSINPSPTNNGLAPCPPNIDSSPSSDDSSSLTLGFDPVEEWLVDPDEAAEVVEESPSNGFPVDRPNPHVKMTSGFELGSSIGDRMENVSSGEGAYGDLDVSSAIPDIGDEILALKGDRGVVECCAHDREMANGFGLMSADGVKGQVVREVYSNSKSIKMCRRDEDDSDGDSDETETESDDSSSEDEPSSSCGDEVDDHDSDCENTRRAMYEIDEIEEGEIRDVDCAEVGSCGDDDEVVAKEPIRSKHEIEVLPPVPHVEVFLEPYHRALLVGVVSSILGNKVIVDGSEKHNPLNEGSILWITKTRMPLGFVDEILGPVKNPYYVVRFNSNKEVPSGLCMGTAVSFVKEFACQILNDKDLFKKGYDASGDNDEEVSDGVEFSDDEKEAEYKRSMRQAKRATNDQGYGNQNFDLHKKRNNFRGSAIQKDRKFPASIEPSATFHPLPGVSNPLPAATVTADFACRSYAGNGCHITPHVVPPVPGVPLTGCLQNLSQQLLQPLPTSCWIPPVQTQQHHMGLNGGCLMNSFPTQQSADQTHQQNQAFNNFSNGMPLQQQFPQNLTAPGNLPLVLGLPNLLAGLISLGLTAQSGLNQAQAGFGIVPYNGGNVHDQGALGFHNGQSNVNLQPINFQGMHPPMQFNPRRSSPRGRIPYRRGGRHPFGRGGRQQHR